jgi:ATP phosphoribosyltransferase
MTNRPVINLMGCHYQPELIMAKADERIRKQQVASSKSKKAIQSRLQHIETVIEEKVVREIIPSLKNLGAEGIIEYPLNKVVY